TGNPVLDAYLRQVKPYNFLGVLQKSRPRPTDSFQAPYAPNKDLGAVAAPLSTKPIEQWEWADIKGGLHVDPITRATWAGLTADEAAAWGRMVVGRTYRELLEAYRLHPELKSAGPDGWPAGPQTACLLGRRAVVLTRVVPIGKETRLLEERQA